MTAQVVPGTTFAPGGSYTAGHFNDDVRLATIANIDRSTIDQTVGTLVTRAGSAPPSPYFKESWVDTSPGAVQIEPMRSYNGTLFDIVDPYAYYFKFNNGNGASAVGAVLQPSASAPDAGVVFAGICALATGALIGVASRSEESAGGNSRVVAQLFGFAYLRVVHVVTAGDYLGPSAQNGIVTADTTYNTERDVGSTSPNCIAQAMESSADAGVKLIFAKLFR
jgi:hypothetical protein